MQRERDLILHPHDSDMFPDMLNRHSAPWNFLLLLLAPLVRMWFAV